MFPKRHSHIAVRYLPSIYANSKVDYPFDFKGMEKEARTFFEKENIKKQNAILIYVTGLTSALICLLNVLHDMNLKAEIYLMHYNNDTRNYISQKVKM